MQRNIILFGLCVLLLISGCAEKEVKKNNRPDWIDEPDGYFVGKCATHVRGAIAQEQCAYKKGLAYIATAKGISLLRIPYREDGSDYAGLKIFPSPYHIPAAVPLVIDGLRQGSQVKIFTVSGRLVRHLTVEEGDVQGYQALWDGRNSRGQWVGSGVYLVAAYLAEGQSGVGKVAVIRRR